MKKLISAVLCLVMILSLSNTTFANENVTVQLNGEVLEFDVQPQIINGRTMVPMRVIFENLGAAVEWDDTTRTVTAQNDNITVSITIDDTTLYKNNTPIVLDVPAQLFNGRTLVPLRAVSEAFDCNVDWISETKSVILTSKDEKSKKHLQENKDTVNEDTKTEAPIVKQKCVVGQQYTSANGYGVTIEQADVKKIKGVKTLVFKYTLENLTEDKYINEETFLFGFTDGTYSNQGGIHLDGMYPKEKLTKTFNLILQDKELSFIMFNDYKKNDKKETTDTIDYEYINEQLNLVSGKIPQSYFETHLVWYFE